jgi:asparaginyl-tRNA synthetase
MNSEFVSVKQAYLLPVGSKVILRGWVRSRRDSKGVTFIELNDGSRFRSMQLVVDSGTVPEETLRQVTTGSSIAAHGILVESPAKGQPVELKVARSAFTARRIPRRIRCKKKDIRSSSCARSPTCVCAATLLAQSFACAML